MSTTRRMYRKNRRKPPWKVILLSICILMFSGVIFYAIDLSIDAKNATSNIFVPLDKDSEKGSKNAIEKVRAKDEAFTMLMVGVENQENSRYGRSDVLIVVTVNPRTEKISMVSIPRDSLVYIPDLNNKNKINHSFANGGINYTINTVEELLDIPIDYYVTTDFDGFEDIVDTLGGIDVTVPFTFKAQLTETLKWKTYTEGEMTLNGKEALAYVRMRKSDPQGDLGRNNRQKDVIKEIVDKGTSLSSITKIDDMIEDVGNNVKSNIPPNSYLSLIKMYQSLRSAPIEQYQIEGTDEYINNIYYFRPDEDSLYEISEKLKLSLDDFGQAAMNPTDDNL